MSVLPSSLRVALERALGAEHVLTDPSVTAGFAVDWTGRYVGRTPAVLRPAGIDEVAAVLPLLADAGLPVVPQGGNTGLVGGSVPLDGEVVLSLARLDGIGEVDPTTRQVTAGAGASLASVERAARRLGLRFGVQISSAESATVGGAVATNAGGARVSAHGGMREQLTGAVAVRTDGSVLSHTGGLAKDNTGPRWELSLAGSEGTCAVVAAARLRLLPVPVETVVALVGVADLDGAVDLAATLPTSVAGVEAVELMTEAGMRLVCDRLGLPTPLDRPAPYALLVEIAGGPGTTERAAEWFGSADVVDVAVGVDDHDRRRLWWYREGHTEAIAMVGIARKCDVAVPLSRWPAFLPEVDRVVAEHGGWSVQFGHIADGNLHLNILGTDLGDATLDARVFELVAAHGGSISAEHGIGRMKLPYWSLNRSDAELDLFASVRRAWDPAGILNPAVLLVPSR